MSRRTHHSNSINDITLINNMRLFTEHQNVKKNGDNIKNCHDKTHQKGIICTKCTKCMTKVNKTIQ